VWRGESVSVAGEIIVNCKQAFGWVSRLKKTYQPVEGFPDKIDPKRVEGIQRILETILEHCGDVGGKSFLDIGSNLGYFCLELARRGAHTLGVETDSRRVKVAQCLARSNEFDATFLCKNAIEFVEDNPANFDYVILLNVFHHILVQDEAGGWAMFNKLVEGTNGVFVMMRNSLKDWSLCRTKRGIPEAVLDASSATDLVSYQEVHGRVIYFFWKD